jgi:hypothetical protein
MASRQLKKASPKTEVDDSLAPRQIRRWHVRGEDTRTGRLVSYVDLEARVRRDHPLRAIRMIVNEALLGLEREFAGLYAPTGRPSIPPKKLVRAMLLQAFYSIRSGRLLMEWVRPAVPLVRRIQR